MSDRAVSCARGPRGRECKKDRKEIVQLVETSRHRAHHSGENLSPIPWLGLLIKARKQF